jgi:hypothetical protein
MPCWKEGALEKLGSKVEVGSEFLEMDSQKFLSITRENFDPTLIFAVPISPVLALPAALATTADLT